MNFISTLIGSYFLPSFQYSTINSCNGAYALSNNDGCHENSSQLSLRSKFQQPQYLSLLDWFVMIVLFCSSSTLRQVWSTGLQFDFPMWTHALYCCSNSMHLFLPEMEKRVSLVFLVFICGGGSLISRLFPNNINYACPNTQRLTRGPLLQCHILRELKTHSQGA
jgi:hypothetical protein